MHRRHFLFSVGTVLSCSPLYAQTYTVSQAERLVADIQDGGKILFVLATGDLDQSRRLGAALRALNVPLNEIWTSRTTPAWGAALAAFSEGEVNASTELDFQPETLLVRFPPPGNNRVLFGPRALLEKATKRSFAGSDLAVAVFLPGKEIHLLGTVSAARIIRSAEARGALKR